MARVMTVKGQWLVGSGLIASQITVLNNTILGRKFASKISLHIIVILPYTILCVSRHNFGAFSEKLQC